MSFLEQFFIRLGFPMRWIILVMAYVRSVYFSILLNDSFYGYFSGKTNVRYGDPLLPLFFVITMDYISCAFSKMFDELDMGYHPKCKKIHLSHFFLQMIL